MGSVVATTQVLVLPGFLALNYDIAGEEDKSMCRKAAAVSLIAVGAVVGTAGTIVNFINLYEEFF